MRSFKKTRRKALIAAAAGVLVFGSAFAMAASLGGITGASLGADSGSSTACDTDGVSTSYTTAYDATDTRYEVTDVTVSGINDACDGKTLSVTVSQTDGTALSNGSAAIPSDGASQSVTVTLTAAVSAELLTDIHVVIA